MMQAVFYDTSGMVPHKKKGISLLCIDRVFRQIKLQCYHPEFKQWVARHQDKADHRRTAPIEEYLGSILLRPCEDADHPSGRTSESPGWRFAPTNAKLDSLLRSRYVGS